MLVKEDTTDDYLVAGRGMNPALAALSAVSTWNSGYMFIGYIGFTFTMGYSIIWIGLGSLVGQIVAAARAAGPSSGAWSGSRWLK